jgi:hypothetical protein
MPNRHAKAERNDERGDKPQDGCTGPRVDFPAKRFQPHHELGLGRRHREERLFVLALGRGVIGLEQRSQIGGNAT